MALSVWLAYLSSSGEQALDRAVREQSAAQEAGQEATTEDAESGSQETTAPAQETPEDAELPDEGAKTGDGE